MRFIQLGVSYPQGFSQLAVLTSSCLLLLSFFRSAILEEASGFSIEPHFHPKSTEYFTITGGKMHFKVDGKEYIVQSGDNFVIPRGAVHEVFSPKGEHAEFKIRGDHDPVEERDFLIQMFTLVETVSAHKSYLRDIGVLITFGTTFRTSLVR